MDKALQTQLANIEKRTGKSLAALTRIVKNSGLSIAATAAMRRC